jgi:endoglucanase
VLLRKAVLACAVTTVCAGAPSAHAAVVERAPLSTDGARIVDRTGRTLTIQGVNWFGFETSNHVVHGLWARDYKQMLAQIHGLGFNAIRVPFSLQMMRSTNTSGIDFGGGRNAALQGKTPLQALDEIVAEARRQDLLVILDNHSLSDDGYAHDLWYGQGGYSEDDWVEAWRTMARRYGDDPNVVGADLKNEPHGAATWGTGAATDWRRAATRAGNAIQAIAPQWLILVEGIEGRTDGQQLAQHWWGGNLEGVRHNPVTLSQPHKLVYSPHEYGPGVFNQPWFSAPDMSAQLEDRWAKGFGFITQQRIAPVLVGEFGGRQTTTDTTEGRWQRQFMDYLSRTGTSWTYWSWNPNSGDTGGVLKDDWTATNADKVGLLQALMRGERIGSTPGSGTPTPTDPPPPPTPTDPTPPTEPVPTGSLTAAIRVDSQWGSGACVHVTVTNAGGAVTGLRLRVTLPAGQTVTSSWNGTFTRSGTTVNVALPSWASSLGAGATYDATGFCVSTSTVPATVVALADGVTPPTPAPDPTPDPQPPLDPTPPTPTPDPQPPLDPTPPTPGALAANAELQSAWDGGYCAGLKVTNTGGSALRAARVAFALDPRATITQSWSGTVARAGSAVSVTLPDWAGPLAPGASATTFGFCASYTGTRPLPTAATASA